MRIIGIALIAIWVVLIGVIFIHWDTPYYLVDPKCGGNDGYGATLQIACATTEGKRKIIIQNYQPSMILPSLALPVVGAGLIALHFTKPSKRK